MKQAEEKPRWFFVDEAGDPVFYAKRNRKIIVGQPGCSKTLILGFVRTYDPQQIRSKLAEVRLAISKDKYKTGVTTTVSVHTSQPIQEPALQAVDYFNWAVQRAFERLEMRYFEFIREKIELVWDIFDFEKSSSREGCIYDRTKNPLDIK